jgi:cell division protein ZipA
MDTLRIVLVVLGIALVVGIYLADRWKRNKAGALYGKEDDSPEFDVDNPALHSFSTAEDELPDEWVGKAVMITPKRYEQLADEHLDGLKGLDIRGEDAPGGETQKSGPVAKADTERVASPDDVIVLTVMAGGDKSFSGPVLLRALQEAGLEHGDMDLFHFHVSGHEIPLFSVANILEPGRFDLTDMVMLKTPGVALFMRLPAVIDGEEALAVLLRKSRQMAARLSGTLCDERRHPLDDTSLAALQAKALLHTANT